MTTGRSRKTASRGSGSGPHRNSESHQAIIQATWDILEEVGYHDLTIDGVAARAAVGKSTIYRWWPSKGALVAETIAAHLNHDPAPETDDVRADLESSIQITVNNYSGTVAGVAIPALMADLAFEPDSYEAFRESFLEPRREASRAVARRVIDSGLLPPDTDLEMLFDIWAGATFYRVLISHEPIGPDFAKALAAFVLGQPPTMEAATTSVRKAGS